MGNKLFKLFSANKKFPDRYNLITRQKKLMEVQTTGIKLLKITLFPVLNTEETRLNMSNSD